MFWFECHRPCSNTFAPALNFSSLLDKFSHGIQYDPRCTLLWLLFILNLTLLGICHKILLVASILQDLKPTWLAFSCHFQWIPSGFVYDRVCTWFPFLTNRWIHPTWSYRFHSHQRRWMQSWVRQRRTGDRARWVWSNCKTLSMWLRHHYFDRMCIGRRAWHFSRWFWSGQGE